MYLRVKAGIPSCEKGMDVEAQESSLKLEIGGRAMSEGGNRILIPINQVLVGP